MARFYVDLPLEKASIVELPIKVVQHINVLRLKNGSSIELFNGNGSSYHGKLIELDKKYAQVQISNETHIGIGNSLDIRIGISIIASDKMDMVIQKSTELGVTQITPIISSRTQQASSLHKEKKLLHWQNIITSSCEQCGLNTLPILHNMQTLDSFIKLLGSDTNNMKVILSPHKEHSNNNVLNDFTYKCITLLVGPEGGFTSNEINFAIDNYFIPLQLGNLIMRAETATIAGIVTMHNQFGNWIN